MLSQSKFESNITCKCLNQIVQPISLAIHKLWYFQVLKIMEDKTPENGW